MRRIIFVGLLFVIMAGCNPSDAISDAIGGKIAEKVAEKVIENAAENDSENVDVKINNGQISIKSDKGSMKMNAGADAKLSDDFPKDVYVPKDAKILMSMDVPEGFSVTFNSKLSQSEILDNYLNESKNNNWKKVSSMDMGEQKMAVFSKDKRTLNIMLSKDSQSTNTLGQITISTKK